MDFTSEGVTVLLAHAVSSLSLSNGISLANIMYCCLVSVTAEAWTAAGTRDTTLMAIDAGL